MDLINYTKVFGLERDYRVKLVNDKYAKRLNRLGNKFEDRKQRGDDVADGFGLFKKQRAIRQYRKADKLQNKIDRINNKIAKKTARIDSKLNQE